MNGNKIEAKYIEEREKVYARYKLLLQKRRQYGWFRFFVFLIMILVTWKVFTVAGYFGFIPLVIGITVLLLLVSKDADNNESIQNNLLLQKLIDTELKALSYDFSELPDGSEFIVTEHPYANDLDLFGPSSLFQFINRAQTAEGKRMMANGLLYGITTPEIKNRHEAIKELANETEWRQQLQAYGMRYHVTESTKNKLTGWLSESDHHFTAASWKIIIPVYSFLSLLSLAATIAGYIPLAVFGFLFLLYVLFSGILLKKASKAYTELSGIIKEVDTVQQLMNWIEGKEFHSPYLKSFQSKLTIDNWKASARMNHLKTILNRFDLLLNPIGNLFLNSFLLWGARQMIDLNKWRNSNRSTLSLWFESIAEFETLNSLANLHFNFPFWTFPELTDQYFTLEAKAAGHPLISQAKRIDNDFTLSGTGKVSIITGSNMAGKSTFLRTLGCNIILAQMGSPVCAESFQVSPVELFSSMRISDNLAEDTSTFYAELKKLKTIIEHVRKHEKMLILLDEILRGTNSLDRHTGSEALITQLIRENAVAIAATHDVELAGLSSQFPTSVSNYHFDVQVEGEELFFDYKLKEGVCKSMNASILMKKIGIEI